MSLPNVYVGLSRELWPRMVPHTRERIHYGNYRACGAEAARIAAEIAARHGFTLDALKSVRRDRPLAYARQEAMATLYATGRYSTPSIGKLFDRDHTTVLHGVRAHAARMAAE